MSNRKTYDVSVTTESSTSEDTLDFTFQVPYGYNVREDLPIQLQRRLKVAGVQVWPLSHRTDNPQHFRVQWVADDRFHEVEIRVVNYQDSLTSCKHPNLSTKQHLTKCPDCDAYFVVKVVNIIAASRGGTKGLHYEFLPSNSLGWTCGGGFTRPMEGLCS